MPHTIEVRVAWGDCDEAGIIFYPNYFYWMDSAFHDFLRTRGLNHAEFCAAYRARGLPIVEANAKFFAAATYGELLRVEVEVAHWGTKSFRTGCKGFRGDQLIFEGYEVRVWAVDGPDGTIRTAPIPAGFRAALAAPGETARDG